MKSAFTSLVAVALFVVAAVAQSTLTVNTPANVVVCQPLQITWSGGTAPYFLSVLPGGDPSGSALEDFGQQTGTSFTWTKVNQPVGTSLGLTLRDSNGLTAQSAPFTVNSGSDTSCLTASASASGTASSASASGTSSSSAAVTSSAVGSSSVSSAVATTSTTPATTAASSASAASSAASTTRPASSATSSSASRSSSAASSAASTSANAVPTLAARYGAAGIIGAVVAAVLA
ncbi:hypothetical protein HETIRDRAFT_439593 [Heterobasidion irregulare TC 32-1]|uniref:Secreted protein n=1 Tax=Heterobasidion irregulare (strain TC 32-1) TaxID=747525 RepID=W4KD78_HETIT|nr:uncharacterized protein HETIRDRAFT_439593 [Heterobasidion irregulare TC 32-1]ETW83041.1 hypothetical protein HETIRDRAFT_439593 [Heterobasidion irregulare TC 32-1]